MKLHDKTQLLRLGVLSLGLAAWGYAGKSLQEDHLFAFEPNVLCLKGSPFGRTIAMAMQGPIDVFWHEGEAHDHVHTLGEACTECDHGAEGHQVEVPSQGTLVTISSDPADSVAACADPDCDHGDHASHGHQHAPGETCVSCDFTYPAASPASSSQADSQTLSNSIRTQLLDRLQVLRVAHNTRTNPLGNSAIHKHYIRREVEKKLALTYQMDPTNYASYGAYFLFLSESSLSNREESVNQALRLAEMTVHYCVRDKNDSQALLTGSAAAHDVVQLVVTIAGAAGNQHAARYVAVAEQLLDGFEQRSLEMAFDGTWENFSDLRRAEMTERGRLLRKLLEADRKTLLRLQAENLNGVGGATAS